MDIKYFDIHSHLESSKFDDDREETVSRMQGEGVFSITVGTDLENSKKAVRVADQYENVFASIGLHPTDTRPTFEKVDGGQAPEDFNEKDYVDLVKNPKVVAIGECGLEFFRLGENAEEEKKRQTNIFKKQIDFAVKYDKPLMIHCRDAHTEVLEILESKRKEHGDKVRGNIHFFSGDLSLAFRYIDIGFTISFTGVITFASEYDEIIRNVPLDKIMSETDAPYVAPVPHRGERCEPVYVKEVVKRISEVREMDFEEVRLKMVENAIRFFRIKNL